MIRRVMN